MIAVYQDYRADKGALLMALQARGLGVRLVDAGDIIAGRLEGCDALIMPGGADLYFCEKLNGAGNEAIRAFVEAGGGYLGICAGAYYACHSLDWNDGAIAGPRELALIDAHAVGPLRVYIEDGDLTKSWWGAAPLTLASDDTLSVPYHAGPVFEQLGDGVEILARYAEGPAIIAQGRVVLSSPHIEYTGARLSAWIYAYDNPSHRYEQIIAAMLTPFDAALEALFDAMLDRIRGI